MDVVDDHATPDDSECRDSTPFAFGGSRTGMGFDAHRFSAVDSGRPLCVACLEWPGVGLEGDSDGDVAAHALIDAVLSAAMLGDIGGFAGLGPDSPGAGASGRELLMRCADEVGSHGLMIESASVVVIGNRPRIGERRILAEKVMSRCLGCAVSLTATTTDAMGFTGRGEGVAAMATAVVKAIVSTDGARG